MSASTLQSVDPNGQRVVIPLAQVPGQTPKTTSLGCPNKPRRWAHAAFNDAGMVDLKHCLSVEMREEVVRTFTECMTTYGVEVLSLQFHDTRVGFALSMRDVSSKALREHIVRFARRWLNELAVPRTIQADPHSTAKAQRHSETFEYAADREITPEERTKILRILRTHYKHILVGWPQIKKNVVHYTIDLSAIHGAPKLDLPSYRETLHTAIRGDIQVVLMHL